MRAAKMTRIFLIYKTKGIKYRTRRSCHPLHARRSFINSTIPSPENLTLQKRIISY
jgi:hypothetical protein